MSNPPPSLWCNIRLKKRNRSRVTTYDKKSQQAQYHTTNYISWTRPCFAVVFCMDRYTWEVVVLHYTCKYIPLLIHYSVCLHFPSSILFAIPLYLHHTIHLSRDDDPPELVPFQCHSIVRALKALWKVDKISNLIEYVMCICIVNSS